MGENLDQLRDEIDSVFEEMLETNKYVKALIYTVSAVMLIGLVYLIVLFLYVLTKAAI